jgi:acetyl-CoA acyltransferase
MNAYLIAAKRTAIGKAHPDKGLFREVRADAMLAALMNGLLDGLAAGEALSEAIDDIYIGCVGQHLEQGKNIARLAGLLAGLPATSNIWDMCRWPRHSTTTRSCSSATSSPSSTWG